MSTNERLTKAETAIRNHNARLLAITPSHITWAAVGVFVGYGCKVTEGDSDSDMIVSLEGQASGDSSYLNPYASANPTREFQYPNVALCLGGSFFSTDTAATVADAPAAGSARYDIAYIFAGQQDAGFAVAEGTPSAGVLSDYTSNGLQTGAYGEESPDYDPVLPAGALPVARIYVAPEATAITDSDIADLRSFAAPTALASAVSAAEEWANKAEDSLVSSAAGGNMVDEYSALHHAAKASDDRVLAEAAATAAANSAAGAAEIVNIDDVQLFTNQKTLSQAVNSTVAASGSNGIQVVSSTVFNLGNGNATIDVEVMLPDYTPSSTVYLAHKIQDSTNFWSFVLNTDGTIEFLAKVSNVNIISSLPSSIALTTENGKPTRISVVIVRETASAAGSLTYYENCQQLGSTRTIASAATVSLSNTGSLYISGTSLVRHASRLQGFRLFNRALTSVEVLDLLFSGVAFADKWGSQTPVYQSDFSAGVDGWSTATGTAAGNIDSIGGEDDWLQLMVDNANSTHSIRKSILEAGKKYKGSLKYHIPSGQSNVTSISLWADNGFTVIASGLNVLDTPTTVEFEFTQATGTEFRVYANDGAAFQDAGGDDVFYIKEVQITQIGAVLALEPEGIDASLQWKDSSTNQLHAILPAAGATPVRPTKRFEIRHTNTWAGTHELQYAGGVNQNILPTNAWIDSWVYKIEGATIEDIIAGDGSDTDHWVAATSGLAAGKGQFTLATNYDDGTNRKLTIDPDANFTGSIHSTIRGIVMED